MTSHPLRAAYRRRDLRWIKQLVWAYFVLLIFEGALRKWVVPSAANVLLLIRDPLVLTAYFLAWRSGVFPRNVFVGAATAIAVCSVTVGLLASSASPAIAIYGFRTNFWQLPLIFLIPRVFDVRDVERVGYWTLIIAIPMAVLMVLQFLAPASSFINAGAGDNIEQITSALGRIRPPGTFSFISGAIFFYSMVMAFLLYSQFGSRYPSWLVAGATVATICVVAVSGSRTLIASLGVVFLAGLLSSSVLKPQMALRWLGGALVAGVMIYFLSNLSFFQFGLAALDQRVTDASRVEGGSSGFVARALSGYTGFIPALYDAPLFGQGLGMGTNVGLALMVDKSQFIWFEDEWARHVLESGPLLGLSFILYRVALTFWMGAAAVHHVARHDPLAVLLFGAVFLTLLNGSLGQTTNLGFVVLLSGLTLAAMRSPRTLAPNNAINSAPVSAREPVLA